MDALQLPSDEIWQVAEYSSSLAEAYKAVYRAKMDLTNMKYTHLAMVCYT